LKALFLAVVAVTTATSVSAGQTPATAESEVRALDAGWARSYQVHDTAYAISLFADDVVITATNGSLKNKNGELADIRPNANLKMDYFRTKDVNVRVMQGAAVVTGLAEWSFTFNGRPSQVTRRYTAVYEKGGPLGWRIVAMHIGRAPE
jgi:ketosteroid isomerase-like protein